PCLHVRRSVRSSAFLACHLSPAAVCHSDNSRHPPFAPSSTWYQFLSLPYSASIRCRARRTSSAHAAESNPVALCPPDNLSTNWDGQRVLPAQHSESQSAHDTPVAAVLPPRLRQPRRRPRSRMCARPPGQPCPAVRARCRGAGSRRDHHHPAVPETAPDRSVLVVRAEPHFSHQNRHDARGISTYDL